MMRGNLQSPVPTQKIIAHRIIVSETIRERVDSVRVLCVLFMMYVHVPNGVVRSGSDQAVLNTRADHWLESIFIEGPGRASAALLSVVSGYLIAVTLLKGCEAMTWRSLLRLYQRRAVSILLPMCVWAALTCSVYLALDHDGASFVSMADGYIDRINLVLFLTEAPYGATMHLGFLRDLFVCILLSPLLLVALRVSPGMVLGALTLVYLSAHSVNLLVILRPLVILGFAIGMWLALRRLSLIALDEYWSVFLALMSVFAVLIIWTHAGMLDPVQDLLATYHVSLLESVLYPLCRLSGSLALWSMLPLFEGKRLSRLTAFLSPYLFAAYCSHFLVLSVVFNAFWLPLVGDRDAYAYLLWFITAPLLAAVSAIGAVKCVEKVNPPMARLLTGGRLNHAPRLRGGRLAQAT